MGFRSPPTYPVGLRVKKIEFQVNKTMFGQYCTTKTMSPGLRLSWITFQSRLAVYWMLERGLGGMLHGSPRSLTQWWLLSLSML